MNRITQVIVKADKVAYAISRFCAIITGVLIALISAMIAFYIINRSFFGFTWLFVEEWTSMAMVAISFLGLGYTLRKGRHIYVDVALRKFSKRTQLFFTAFAALFSLMVLFCMLERSMDLLTYDLLRDVRSTGPMRTPLWIPTLAMNIGIVVCIIDFIFLFLDKVLRILNGSDSMLNFSDENR